MGPFASATSRATCSLRVAMAARRLIQSMEPCEPMLVMATFVPQDGLIHWTPARGRSYRNPRAYGFDHGIKLGPACWRRQHHARAAGEFCRRRGPAHG